MSVCACQNTECLLCEAHLYDGLSSEQICRIQGMIHKNYYDEGDILFLQGEASDQLHVVRSGLIKLSISDAEGNEQIISLCVAGRVVGFDVPGDSKHPYTAETLTPAVTCSVRQADMLKVYEKNPDVARRTIQMLTKELTYAQHLIHTLGQKSSTEKMALLILSLIPEHAAMRHPITLPLPLTRKEIAQFLGLTVETVSRLVSDFKKNNYIETSRAIIRVLDVEALKQVAGIGSASITDSLNRMIADKEVAN